MAARTKTYFDLDILPLPEFLREYFNYCVVVRNLAAHSIKTYYVQISKFCRWAHAKRQGKSVYEVVDAVDIADVELEDIAVLTEQDIYAYLAFTASFWSNSANSRGLAITALKSLYKYHTGITHELTSNPMQQISKPKKEKALPKYLSIKECRSLVDCIDGPEQARDKCMVILLLNCGMRLSELVSLDLSDIREDTMILAGKGRKERTVYLNEACQASIAKYLEERGIGEDYDGTGVPLFVSQKTGKRITVRRVEQILEKLFVKTGLAGRGYSTHKLRHTAATMMYQAGADVLILKEILGHESTATTEIYPHLNSEQVKDIMLNSPLKNV